jgi:hypothetical protein
VGDSVWVEGQGEKRGVVTKRRGRILTVEYKGERSQYETPTIDVDQKLVHKI